MRGYERLVAIVGEAAAETLCRRRGGRGVYIPDGDAGELVKLVGLAPTRALRRELGSGTYTVPLGPTSTDRQRRRWIRSLLAQGLSASDVARRTGAHISTVRKLNRP